MLFRKFATILLLTFLFFNWVGYWLFISWFESHAETQWEQRLDSDQYDASQLVRIKVPADHVPYSNASSNFERTDGIVDIGTTHYRYVGKRLYNDSIEFLCLPDWEAARLRTAKNDFFSLVNDLQNAGHGKTPGPLGKASCNSLKLCYPDSMVLSIVCFPRSSLSPIPCMRILLPPGYSRILKLPPRAAAFA